MIVHSGAWSTIPHLMHPRDHDAMHPPVGGRVVRDSVVLHDPARGQVRLAISYAPLRDQF